MTSRIGVIGAGYVGLVCGVCFAALGHEVVIRDIDPDRIARLQAGESPIHEPHLDHLIAANLPRLTFTLDLTAATDRADAVFIAVDTPATYSGDADLSRVMAVIDELVEVGDGPPGILVMKSTVPVGTGQRIRHDLDSAGLTDVGYVSNPEFLREGAAIDDFMHPDRVVLGTFRPEHAERVAQLYAGVEAPVLRMSVPSAEMTKYASNAFLATKISFINEIANVCEDMGADVAAVAEGMGLDRRIGPSFLRPGIGFGGSCFPKDVAALKQLAGTSGYHFQLLTSVIEVNELQKRRVVGKLKKHLGAIPGRRIALLGLAFKPGTDDMREAASIALAGRLLAEGASVVAWDPVVTNPGGLSGVAIAPTPMAAIENADACVVVTEWPEIVALDWRAIRATMAHPVIIDGRNALDPDAMLRWGYRYEGIGRSTTAQPDLLGAD
jgi:UDPglucose 6-dehydrogenase